VKVNLGVAAGAREEGAGGCCMLGFNPLLVAVWSMLMSCELTAIGGERHLVGCVGYELTVAWSRLPHCPCRVLLVGASESGLYCAAATEQHVRGWPAEVMSPTRTESIVHPQACVLCMH
jgi:hypothetical protein